MHVVLLVLLALSSPQTEPGAGRVEPSSPVSGIAAEAARHDASHAADVDAALRGVLARREFQRSASSVWLDALRQQVADWATRLIQRLAGSGLDVRAVGVMLAWASSLLALLALSWWLVQMLTRRSRAASLGLGTLRAPAVAAREWAQRALAAARAGDLRESVRCAYHAALCRLEEQGIWRIDESRTPREYVRLLRDDDPRFAVVSDLTRRFEQVWYGRRTATDDDARLVAVHLERLGCLRHADRAI